jgi:homoserine O-acetyltransferase
VCHALTGDADADDWWRGLFGKGRLLDPTERFIVSMSVLGGCAGTTGPPSSDPDTGLPYGPDFPEVTIRDMVRLQRLVLTELGVHHLDVAIGGSMGGMQVLEWAAMYPDVVGSIVPIAVGAAQSAWAVGLSEAQRHAIVTDAGFAGGRYVTQPAAGLATARMVAMCSYRSPQSFAARFGRSEDPSGFAVGSYLRHHGDALVNRFDANAYLTLIGAMDSHDLGRDRGPLEAILHRIETRALVISIDSDVLYPLDEVRALAEGLPHARFAVLANPHGHDAFLIDTPAVDRLVRPFLEAGITASAGA